MDGLQKRVLEERQQLWEGNYNKTASIMTLLIIITIQFSTILSII